MPTFRTTWSPEDGEYVGLVDEFPSLSWLASTPEEALAGITRLVEDEKYTEMALTLERGEF